MRRLKRGLALACCLLMLLAAPVGAATNPEMASFRSIPQPSMPGHQGGHVITLQQALQSQGYLRAEADGAYQASTQAAVAAFQQDKGLAVTGQADAATLRVLFLRPKPAKGDTTRPAWYGGGSKLIPLGAVFQMQDVLTGRQFTAMRVHGTSHLDAEPLTAGDTDIMFNVYNREWSWDRRPILLKYRGEVIAASMNGKPHGWEILPGNNMTGHFCIHFFESRGDGSQRVDPEHLRCVVEASYARWIDAPPEE